MYANVSPSLSENEGRGALDGRKQLPIRRILTTDSGSRKKEEEELMLYSVFIVILFIFFIRANQVWDEKSHITELAMI